jgi:transcriptional regulator with XRE-family HTH domain
LNQTAKLIIALKKSMKAKGLTYQMIAQKLEVSEATIKRSLSEEDSLSMKRLELICQVIGITFSELVRLAELHVDEKVNTLTEEQEEALSLELDLFKIFYLLLRQWSLEKIEENFKVSFLELEKILLKLDQLKLIEYHSDKKVKLLTNRNIKWHKNGPIYKIFEKEMKNNFLAKAFDHVNEKFTMLSGTLSQASKIIVKEKMNRFEKEIEEIIEMDVYLEKDTTESMAIILALGPVNLSIFQ